MGKVMKIERLNAWFGLAGNVAVLLGLVALALEINANTKALRVQISEQTFLARQDRLLAMAANKDLQTLYVKALLDPAKLTPSEAWGATAFIESRIAYTRRSFYRYKDGLMTEDSWKDDLSGVSYYLDGAFGQLLWSELKDSESPDFVAEVDSELAESKGKGLSNDEWLREMHKKIANLDL
jgi:hypothetical protein